VLGGLAALSLDAMASVAYGPEAIVLVLSLGGSAAIGLTLPVTIAIAVLLLILVLSYRQVIAAFPDGGGSYGVAKRHLGRRASLVAGANDQHPIPPPTTLQARFGEDRPAEMAHDPPQNGQRSAGTAASGASSNRFPCSPSVSHTGDFGEDRCAGMARDPPRTSRRCRRADRRGTQ
jgi:hypothetical protein